MEHGLAIIQNAMPAKLKMLLEWWMKDHVIADSKVVRLQNKSVLKDNVLLILSMIQKKNAKQTMIVNLGNFVFQEFVLIIA